MERLETENGRGLFAEFFAWFSVRNLLPNACGRLDRYIDFFERIDQEIYSGTHDSVTGVALATIFTAEQLRKATTPLCFLAEAMGVCVDADLIEKLTEERRIADIIANADESEFRAIIEKFRDDLLARDHPPALHTVRVYLRSALTFLEESRVKNLGELSQAVATKVLLRKPGLRASLSTFFSFLGANHGLDLKSMKPKRTPAAASEKRLDEDLHYVLSRLEGDQASPEEKKALTVFALSKLYGFPLKKALALKKNDLIKGPPMQLKIDGHLIPVEERLAVRLYIPDNNSEKSGDFLFEGRVSGRPMSVGAVAYWVERIRQSAAR